MRTTIDIADDVLAAAKELARQEKSTAGEVLSRLARRALLSAGRATELSAAGFPTLPRRGTVVTQEHVNAIREIEGI